MAGPVSMGLPTASLIDTVIAATGYCYEAGEYPPTHSFRGKIYPGLAPGVARYVDGDGGLLNALTDLKMALADLEALWKLHTGELTDDA